MLKRFLRPRREHGATAVVVALSATAMLGIMAIAIEYSKAVSHRVHLQHSLDEAALGIASLCADNDASVLNCGDGAAVLARAQVFAELNSSATIVTSADVSGKQVTLTATSTQRAPLLAFVQGAGDSVSESATSAAAWTSAAGSVPLRGTTPPFALDACAWMTYNAESGTSPGTVQRYNMINDTSDFRRASWTSCMNVPGLPASAKAAGLDRQMLWITWDKGDVSGTHKQDNCELAFKADGVNIARDIGTSLPDFAAADDGWDDVKDRACVGVTLGTMRPNQDMLMPIVGVVPSSSSWSSSSRSWEDLQYDPDDAPTFRVIGYAPFRITGFLDRSGNPTLTTCTVRTGSGYDRDPVCTGVAGKFITKVGEFDDYEYGDGSSTGIVDLGNTDGGVSLVR